MGRSKLEDCPTCGDKAVTLEAGVLIVTGCLNSDHEPNGQPGRTKSDSKRNWNNYARKFREKEKDKS